MASVVPRPNGHKWIQFRHGGKRRTLRLGKSSQKQANDVRIRVESILSALLQQAPIDPSTSEWIGNLPPMMHRRLSATGLANNRSAQTVGELTEAFKISKDSADNTFRNLRNAKRVIEDFFGKSRYLTDITAGDAQDFVRWLREHGRANGEPLAKATVNRRVRRAKQIFKYAKDKEWIHVNPFGEISCGRETNKDRFHFVEAADVKAIIGVCTEPEFPAILALARWGGVRSPSEIVPLKWSQINWEKGAIYIYDRKRKTEREVPIFPELRPYLVKLWDAAAEREDLLFPSNQGTGAALTSKLKKRAKLAGVSLWQKPWQNMRSTRETELMNLHPAHCVAAWIGHTLETANQHYLQITNEHFRQAVAGESPFGANQKGEAKTEEEREGEANPKP